MTTFAASVTIVDLPVGTTVTGAELFEAVQTTNGVGQSVQLSLTQIVTSITGGLPTGGGTGQILNKTNANNYSTTWSSITQFVAVGTALATTGSATSIVAFVANQGITSTQIANNAIGTNQLASSIGIASSVSIGTLLTVGGTATFNGGIVASGTFGLTGSALLTGSFGVVGTSQFTGILNVAGTTNVTGTFGQVGAFGVVGTALFTSGAFGVVGTALFTSGTFGVVGITNLTGTFGQVGTSLMTGLFGVSGTALHTGLFTVVGTSTFTGGFNFNVVGTAQFTSGAFNVNGTSLFTSGAFGVVGTSTFTGTHNIVGTTILTGSLALGNLVTGFLSTNGTGVVTATTIVQLATATSTALGADVNLTNITTYFDGPSVAQGTSGTWFASGSVVVTDPSAAQIYVKLWDGSTVISSIDNTISSGFIVGLTLSGFITNPVGNLRLSCRDISNTTGKILFNTTGNSRDANITAIRIG